MGEPVGGNDTDMAPRPALVIVTGPPASGKTSAAERIAEALQLAVLTKDTFKETLYEELGSAEELEEPIEQAALSLLFAVAGMQLEAGVSLLVESNFDAQFDVAFVERLHREHDVELVQVHIGGETDRLVAKFARRAQAGDRHPGHRDSPADAAELREKIEAGLWEPLGISGTLVRADMDDDEDEIVRRVRAVLDER
jgi:predicted kinase